MEVRERIEAIAATRLACHDPATADGQVQRNDANGIADASMANIPGRMGDTLSIPS
jgi:hypothetical protein